MATEVWAACSAYAGKITINEYNVIGPNTPTGVPFVELKFVDPAVLSAVKNQTWSFAGWTLTAYRANGQVFSKDLGAIYTGQPSDTANNYCQNSTNLYFRVPFDSNEVQDQANIVLLDADGYLVDELRAAMKKGTSVANYYTPPSSPRNCGLCEKTNKNLACAPNSAPQLLLDTDYEAGNAQDQKNIQRLPDGTGIWKEAVGGGNNSEDTLCTTNDNILLVTKTASTYSVAQGGSVTYTIAVRNGSATTAMNGVTVTDVIPVGLAFQSRTISTGSTNTLAPGTTNPPGAPNPAALIWNVGLLAVGAPAATMTVAATVNDGNSAITNTAEASATELNGGSTQGSATINAIRVTVTPSTSTPALNGNVTYTVTVTNISSATAYDLQASLPFPSGLAYVNDTATVTQGTFAPNQVWTIGSLAAGTSATLTLTAQATQTGTLTFTATATSATSFPGSSFTGSADVTVPASSGSFAIDVPNFKAGDATQGTITAPKVGGVVVAGFANATRQVKFYTQATVPASGASGTMKLDAYEFGTNTVASVGAVAGSLAGATVRDIYFDANGVGRFDLNYDNVGQFSLFADWQPAYEASPPAGAPSSLTGSDAFVVSPYRYAIAPSVASLAGGASFDLTVTAQSLCGKDGWGYACPPEAAYTTATNFTGAAATDVALKVKPTGLNAAPALWCTTVTATCPADETSAPVVPASLFGSGGNAAGVATLSGLHWSEVGTAVFQGEANYLGSGTSSADGGSASFHPVRFNAGGSVTSAAGSYVYYGQPALEVAQTITAQVTKPDASYATAKNYAASVYGGTLATVSSQSQAAGVDVNVCPNAGCSTPVTNGSPSCTWTQGECVVAATAALFQRIDDPGPTSPKTVGFTVRITDTENKVSACVKTVAPASCVQTGNVFSAAYGSLDARYGRLRLVPGQGSARADYYQPVEAQYWTGSAWITNVADSSTPLAVGNAAVTGVATLVAATTINQGFGSVRVKPTGSGTATVCLDLHADPNGCAATAAALGYLRGNWATLAPTVFDRDPSATINFGLPQPKSRANWGYIYRRENF